MGEQTNHQQLYPLAPASKMPRSDEESNTLQSNELRRKKRIKLATYIAAFAVFQTIVIVVFSLTVMKVKTPKVRLGTVELQNVSTTAGTRASSPFFDISFTTQIRVKNPNFGPYKYDSANATFLHQGASVGEIFIPKGKAGMLSTKKVDVTVSVNSKALTSTTSLGNELGAGTLTLNSQARISGKVKLMFVMKKNKTAQMNCTIIIKLSTDNAVDLNCK